MIKRWLYNARSFAAPQNLMPSILAVVLAINVEGFNLLLGLLAVFGVCMVHLGGNLLDDYFDWQDELLTYREELRKEGEQAFTDKYPYMRDGSTTVAQLRNAIIVFFGAVVSALHKISNVLQFFGSVFQFFHKQRHSVFKIQRIFRHNNQ